MVKKILGTRNPADVLTKPKACHEVAELLRGAGIRIEGRRPQPLRHASSITIPDVRNGMPEKMPVEKPTTTMPPQGRTEAFGLGAETCGEGCGSSTTEPLVSKKPYAPTTTKFEKTKMPYKKDFTTSHREASIRGEPCGPHETTQRITPGEAEARRRERVSMRECGPIQRGRPCAADCDVVWMSHSHASGSDLRRALGRSAWAFAGIGSE